MKQYHKRAWAEVHLKRLEYNINTIKNSLYPETNIMAVIKADAYGHGEDKILNKLWSIGVKYFAVSNLDEAISVRNNCPQGEILILGYTPPEYALDLEKYNIIQSIVSTEHAELLSKNAKNIVRCHIKIDTGMNRLGLKFSSIHECSQEIENICNINKLSIEGIFTHFAVADSQTENDITFTQNQKSYIENVYDLLKTKNINLKHLHYLNSAGACYHNSRKSTLARIGITMYGLHPDINTPLPYILTPVMELKAIVSEVKKIYPGDCVSYGRTYEANKEINVATVTVGYADGYSRLLSSKGEVLLKGEKCRIIGRICMDQLMIDISNLHNINAGDVVTLIGIDNKASISADEVAKKYDTIGYEVVCGISKRVPRIYIE